MHKLPSHSLLEYILPSAVILFLFAVTYAGLFQAPYVGLSSTALGEVGWVLSRPAPLQTLQIGDQIVRVGTVEWEEYLQNPPLLLYRDLHPGDNVSIQVQRGGRLLQVTWVLPGFTLAELFYRLNLLWLPYIFWAAGAATMVLVRPKDTRWHLLVAMNFLTAVWLIAGMVSELKILSTHLIYREVIWLSIPVYLHLHWEFPRPLGHLPRPWLWILYGLGGLLALLQIFQALPLHAYFAGLFLAALGSLAMLAAHFILRPQERRDLRLSAVALGVICLTAIPLSILGLVSDVPAFGQLTLASLPLLPGAYFYVVYRRRSGNLELRANRLILFYLYAILLSGAVILVAGIAQVLVANPHSLVLLGVNLAVAAGLLSAWLYPRFLRWAEPRLLGMPAAPTHLLEDVSARITTSLEQERLIHLIRDEFLPALLIRQAALLRLNAGGSPTPVFCLGVSEDMLPDPGQVKTLLAEVGILRLPAAPGEAIPSPCPWVRLALLISAEGQAIGLCLFGRRDPDDDYAPTEIPTLQAALDQTGVALLHIEQAERLRRFYQTDIERQEAERQRLALELHDDVLSQLAVLAMSAEECAEQPQFAEAYHDSVRHIRSMISGLWPGMLNFGLWPALEELADEVAAKAGGNLRVQVDLPDSQVRYPPEIELHLFRIVQQAVQNVLKHARANELLIYGRLAAGQVDLEVRDDGVGFNLGESPDLAWLLANKHFGLASMHERAALIGAEIQIASKPGYGSEVRLHWEEGSE